MRAIFFVVAFTLAFIKAAAAQDTESQRVAAARELIISVTSDDRILDMFEAAARGQVASLQQAMMRSPSFPRFTPEHQAALLAAAETVPQVFRNEFSEAMEPVAIRMAHRISALMSTDDFLATAQAFRDPENDLLFLEYVERGLSGSNSDSAFPDLSRTESGRRFLATSAGQAFSRARVRIDQIITEESVALGTFGARLRTIGMTIACDALGDECPSSTRRQLGRP